MHGGTAILLDATPVEVVAHVEDKVRIRLGGPCPEGIRNQDLWLRIYAWHKATARHAVLALVLSPIETLVAQQPYYDKGTLFLGWLLYKGTENPKKKG